MRIKFFEKDGHINPESIYAGIYQFKIGLLMMMKKTICHYT